MILIFSFLDDLNHCCGPGMWITKTLVQMAPVPPRFQGFQGFPIWIHLGLRMGEMLEVLSEAEIRVARDLRSAKRRDPVEDPPWIMLDVCVGTGMNLNITCFPMSAYVYIYAYDDRYKCSIYKCSFQLAIATQSSRCRSHPILTGNPLWMPSSSYTANLHELWHPRIHWFQYCGTSIVLRIS
jgi:hypothetical protein